MTHTRNEPLPRLGPDGRLRCSREARPDVAAFNTQVRPHRQSCCRLRRLMSRNLRAAGRTITRRCRRGSTRRRSGSSGCRSSVTRRCGSYTYYGDTYCGCGSYTYSGYTHLL
eukprot:scaffold85757_cov67-Phaeocystis_antarctica.AAC.10